MFEKAERFMFYEKFFFRINLFLMTAGILSFVIMQTLINELVNFADIFLNIVVGLMYATITIFLLTFVRLIKYLVIFSKNSAVTIKRTIVILLSSPLYFAVYFLVSIVLSLSMASCTG